MPVRVVVADDHPVMLLGLLRVLASHPDIEVVAQAIDGARALACIKASRPDVALVDFHMPMISGSQVAAQTAHDHPDTTVLIYTAADRSSRERIALMPGVHKVLGKDLSPAEIRAAVLRAAESRNVGRRSYG